MRPIMTSAAGVIFLLTALSLGTPPFTNSPEEDFTDEEALLFLTGQDSKKPKEENEEEDDGKEEIVTLEVKVGQRPGGSGPMNVPGFTVNPPLTLAGKAADTTALKDALMKGLVIITSQQNQDGSWSFNPKTQVRKKDSAGKDVKDVGFLNTARDSLMINPRSRDGKSTVLTALCGMALRRHFDLDPQKLGPAIEKALKYVIENAPKHTKERYGPWTWAFSLNFLSEEFQLTKDTDLQARIKESAKGIVQLIVQNQHKAPKKPHEPPSNLKPTAEELKRIASGAAEADPPPKKRPSNSGYFGIIPSESDEIGKQGVLIMTIQPKMPAEAAGMKNGDRILTINGEDVEDLDDLLSLIDSIKPGTVVKVKILRGSGKKKKETMIPEAEDDIFQQERRKQQRPRGSSSRPPPEDGGWAYYRTGSVSFTTATCLLALMDARKIGVEVPEDVLTRGINLLEGLQMRRENTDEAAFRYHTGVPPSKGRGADVRASVGRLGVCGLTLLHAGKYTTGDLAKALEVFVKRRGELDKVKGYPGNHYLRSFLNAAYYFLYSHFYSAKASTYLSSAEQRKKIGAHIQEALLKSRNPDGSWTDHEMWGTLYGTAMAMMALGELKELAPSLYKSVPRPALPQKPSAPVTNPGGPAGK